MRHTRFGLLFLAFLTFPRTLLPGMPGYLWLDSIDREQGLAHSVVSQVVQDRYGFLWIGTRGGLNRYDGYSFRHFVHSPFDTDSLTHNRIQSLLLDGDYLWIGTYHGLDRLHLPTERFTHYSHRYGDPKSLSSDAVVSLFLDGGGTLWVGTLNGLNRFDERTGTFERYIHDPFDPESLSSNTVYSMTEDDEGTLWIGTDNGLNAFDRTGGTFRRYMPSPDEESGPSGSIVTALQRDREGILWVGTRDGGLDRYVSGADLFVPHIRHLAVSALFEDVEETLWVGSPDGGIASLDRESRRITRHRSATGNGTGGEAVLSFFQDESRILWIGTDGGGLWKLDTKRQDLTFFRGGGGGLLGLDGKKVSALLESGTGDIWIGTEDGGASRFRNGRLERYRFDPDDPASLSSDTVTGLLEDRDGNIWISTYRGLDRFREESGGFERFFYQENPTDALLNHTITALAEGEDDSLWLGTYHAGLYRWNPRTGELVRYLNHPADAETLSDNMIYSLAVRRNGSLWVGTNNGLNRFVPESGVFVRYLHDPDDPASLSSDDVRVLFEDSRGTFWVGTISGGLNRFDPQTETFVRYTERDGLCSNSVVSILENGNGTLWIGTHDGMSVFYPGLQWFRSLNVHDGLPTTEFTAGQVRIRDGTMLFGSSRGVVRISDIALRSYARVPKVAITGIAVMGKNLDFERPPFTLTSIHLSHEENFISFSFAALDFTAPGRNQYAYMLEGFDRDWIYPGNRNYASYTNLDGGTYRFRVKGSNSTGVWNEEGTSLTVVVDPPPWRRWWAFLIYASLALVLLWAGAEVRVGKVLRAKIGELEETRQKLEDANDKLEVLSSLDELTHLPNRRRFVELLQTEWRDSIREHRPLSLIMIDIDYFKAYNDNYGHPAGDECLRMVAQIFASSLERPRDVVARYGGEEFVSLLPDTDAAGALYIAERIRQRIEERGICHRFSAVSASVTVSLGVTTTIPSQDSSIDGFIGTADKALYRAKAEGRNRIRFLSHPR